MTSAKVDVLLDITAKIDALSQTVEGMAEVEKQGKRMSESLKDGLSFAVGNKLLSGLEEIPRLLMAGAKRGLEFNIQLEQATTSLTTMLGGNRQAAQGLIGDLQQMAATTPLVTSELNDAAQMMLAFGSSAKEIPGELRRIGDIASGIGAPIGEIAEIYGKARVQGRLFMEDINQLTGRGIPIITELAKQFETTEGNVRDLVSSGQVGFDNLEQAFTDLTDEGGQFFGMMAEQSETVGGKLSTLQDAIDMALGETMAQVFAQTGPQLDKLIAALQDPATNENLAAMSQLLGGISEIALGLGGIVMDGVEILGDAGELWGAVWWDVSQTLIEGEVTAKTFRETLIETNDEVERTGRAADAAEASLDAARKAAAEAASATAELGDSADGASDDVAELAKQEKAAAKAAVALEKAHDRATKAMKDFQEAVQDTHREDALARMGPSEEMIARFEHANELQRQYNEESGETIESEVRKVELLKQIEAEFSTLVERGRELGMTMEQIPQALAWARENAGQFGGSVKLAFEEISRRLLQFNREQSAMWNLAEENAQEWGVTVEEAYERIKENQAEWQSQIDMTIASMGVLKSEAEGVADATGRSADNTERMAENTSQQSAGSGGFWDNFREQMSGFDNKLGPDALEREGRVSTEDSANNADYSAEWQRLIKGGAPDNEATRSMAVGNVNARLRGSSDGGGGVSGLMGLDGQAMGQLARGFERAYAPQGSTLQQAQALGARTEANAAGQEAIKEATRQATASAVFRNWIASGANSPTASPRPGGTTGMPDSFYLAAGVGQAGVGAPTVPTLTGTGGAEGPTVAAMSGLSAELKAYMAKLETQVKDLTEEVHYNRTRN